MQFILLKCAIKWVFIYLQSCATITLFNSVAISSPLPRKKTHYPLAVTPCCPVPSAPSKH